MSTSPIRTVFESVAQTDLVNIQRPTAGGFSAIDASVPVSELLSGLVTYSIDITNEQLLNLSGMPLVVFPATPGKAFFPIAAYIQIGGTEMLTGVATAAISGSITGGVAFTGDNNFVTPGYVSSFAIAIGSVEPNDIGSHLQFGESIILSLDANGADANGGARLTMSGYIVDQI